MSFLLSGKDVNPKEPKVTYIFSFNAKASTFYSLVKRNFFRNMHMHIILIFRKETVCTIHIFK